MSEYRKNRRNLESDDEEDEEEPYTAHKDQLTSARRFLWDEDEDEDIIGKVGKSMSSFSQSIDLGRDSIMSPNARKKRSILGNTDDLKFADRSVDRNSDEYGKAKRRGVLEAACLNFYHTALGGFGMCLEALFSGTGIKCIGLFLLLAGATVGISWAIVKHPGPKENTPSSQEPAPAPSVIPSEVTKEQISDEFRRENITQILEENPAINSRSYTSGQSAQRKALDWLIDVDTYRGDDSISHRYALASFYFFGGGRVSGSTPSSPWTNDDGWMTGSSFCDWYGVECAGNRVVKLILSDNNLEGVIAAEIGALDTLETLDLQKNKLLGSIPSDIANLEHLDALNLMENQLNEGIPDIQTLTSLRELNLGKNLLTSVSGTGFSALTELVALGLQKNKLGGSIDDLKLPPHSLEILYLDDNQLEGTIPDYVYEMTRLRELRVDKNSLGGTISQQIRELANLVILKLDANNFSGTFPDVFDRMPNIVELFLVRNQFTGSIPHTIVRLTNLEQFLLAENKFSGSLPDGMEAMTALKEIYLPENELTGTLPDVFNTMPDISVVKIEKNQFIGTIPASLASCPNLKELILGQNQFDGQVPAELGSLSGLKTVALENNKLTGNMPSEWCTLVNSGSLEFLAADCKREDGVNCECCHMCY